ncbi:hypothetical protein ACSSI5_001148, partial [Enterococcus faecalis]
MKKLNTSKDIILLIELFIDNALRGLLKHSILSKKSTRIVIGVCVFFIYFAYFFYNMSELARIVPDSEKISHILIEQGRKITFYSYFSNTFVLGIIAYILVDNTVALDKNSLFFVKTLPFRKKDISLSFMLFKFVIMILLYELVMIISTPAIKLVTTVPIEYVIFFIVQHLFYLVVIGVIEFIHCLFAFFLKRRVKQINSLKVIGDSLLMIFATFYFFDFRYGLELFLANQLWSISYMIPITFFLIVVCLMLISIGLLRLISILENQMSQHSKYIYIPFLNKVIFRYKANWYFISFTTVVMLVIFFQSGLRTMLFILTTVMAFSGVLLLSYGDITADFRKQYDLLRIKIRNEWLSQLLLVIMLAMPLLLLCFWGFGELAQLITALSLSLVAIILGYVFPKSQGSLNETTSLLLLFIVFVLVSLLTNRSFGWL